MKISLFLLLLISCILISFKEMTASSFQQEKTLRKSYANFFPIGAAIDADPFLKDNSKRTFFAKQYSSVTSENQMKPRWLHPEENTYKWTEADNLISFAQQNNMKVRGHCLIWFNRMPYWFYKDSSGNIVSKDVLLKRMKDHIYTIMRRYKGKVYCWDVVNEAVTNNNKTDELFSPTDSLYKIIGEEYIEKAFTFAHEADPSAILFYNDNSFQYKKKSDKVFQLLSKLKSKGIPIDGLGMQSHEDIYTVTEQRLRENIKQFSSLKLQIQLTELDVTIFDRYSKLSDFQISRANFDYSPELENKQSEIYKMIFRVCRENKGVVTGITFWSAADYPNYINKKFKRDMFPYLFDDHLQPKKCFYEVTNF